MSLKVSSIYNIQRQKQQVIFSSLFRLFLSAYASFTSTSHLSLHFAFHMLIMTALRSKFSQNNSHYCCLSSKLRPTRSASIAIFSELVGSGAVDLKILSPLLPGLLLLLLRAACWSAPALLKIVAPAAISPFLFPPLRSLPTRGM